MSETPTNPGPDMETAPKQRHGAARRLSAVLIGRDGKVVVASVPAMFDGSPPQQHTRHIVPQPSHPIGHLTTYHLEGRDAAGLLVYRARGAT
jgi:hypothetical protein